MAQNPTPPRFLLRLLRWICPAQLCEAIEGDVLEWYEIDVEKTSRRKANYRMFWNIVRFIRPEILYRKMETDHGSAIKPIWFLRTAFRSLKAHRTHTILNGFGLVIGIASALILFSVLKFERSFDTFHTDADQVFRIVRVSQVEGQEEYRTGVVYPMAPVIRSSSTYIEELASVLYWDWEDLKVSIPDSQGQSNKMFSESEGIAFVEGTFFDVLDFNGTGFRWISGNPQTALEDPFTMVISESAARRYFGDESPMGKLIVVNNDSQYTVTGVISDLPANTDFPLQILLSYPTLLHYVEDMINEWSSVGNNQVYFRAKAGLTKPMLDAHLHELHAAHTPEELHSFRKYKAQPLAEVHTDSRFGNFNHRTVSEQKFWALVAIGIFLLLSACINFINLATATATLRAHETGVRKVLGSSRGQLVLQFLTESFLLTLASGVLALLVAELVSHYFQNLLGTDTGSSLLTDWMVLAFFATTIILVTLLAGIYPALVLSGFDPQKALKGTHGGRGKLFLRRLLVFLQFALSIAFVIGTTTVFRQVSYFQTIDLGFKRDAIVNMNIPDNGGALDVFANDLRRSPIISKVSYSSSLPSGLIRSGSYWGIRVTDDGQEALVTEVQFVDTSYFELYRIPLVAGRNFRPNDQDRNVILNETVIRKLGFTSAESAVGQTCQLGQKRRTIIGVIADFHSKSLRNEVAKMAFLIHPERTEVVSIELDPAGQTLTLQKSREALDHIERAWHSTFPEDAMNYQFFDDNIAAFYVEERRFSGLLQAFTIVLIFIGSLGLYGLMSFIISQRMKEMAVRKTFGASVTNIMRLLSTDFVRLVVLAFLISVPIAHVLMERWLQDFSYRVTLHWWMHLIPLVVVILVVFISIAGKSLKAASVNPATILRNE